MRKRIILLILVCLFLMPTRIVSAEPDIYSIDGVNIPVDIVVNGKILKTPQDAFLDGGTVYVPLRAIAECTGAVVAWNGEQMSASVERNGEIFVYTAGTDAVLYKDTMFVPVRMFCERLGFSVTWDGYYCQVILSDAFTVLSEQQTENAYTNEDILLIAQVLQCECAHSSFEGKLAVANVITNRVASQLFPNTVKEVIYDRRYGSVQFTIAYNGKLNNTPNAECILAAKCSLNGTVVAKDCLFYQAEYVTNSWMDRNRQYAACFAGNKFFY